jgi:hypothetical protein
MVRCPWPSVATLNPKRRRCPTEPSNPDRKPCTNRYTRHFSLASELPCYQGM